MRGPEILFRSLALPIVFVLVALGFHFFLRGHNAPGGGFIAGLLVAAAALLIRMARNERLLRIPADRLFPWGLLVAAVTGIVPMALGYGFLKSAYGYLTWPLIGEFEWATAVAFDAGVFLVVVGITVTIIDLLAEEGGLALLGDERDASGRAGATSRSGGATGEAGGDGGGTDPDRIAGPRDPEADPEADPGADPGAER